MKNEPNEISIHCERKDGIEFFRLASSPIRVCVISKEQIKNNKIKEIPTCPGIYLGELYSRNGQREFYVGETKNLQARLKGHDNKDDKMHISKNVKMIICIYSLIDGFEIENNRKSFEYKLSTLLKAFDIKVCSQSSTNIVSDQRAIARMYEDILILLKSASFANEFRDNKNKKSLFDWSEPIINYMEDGKTYTKTISGRKVKVTYKNKSFLLHKGSELPQTISTNMNFAHYSTVSKYFSTLEKTGCLKDGMIQKNVTIETPYKLLCLLTGTSSNASYDRYWYDQNGVEAKLAKMNKEEKSFKKAA